MHFDWSIGVMHLFWWLLWIAVIVVLLIVVFTPVLRDRRRETIFDILLRRHYEAGELSSDEYKARKRLIRRGSRPPD